MTTARKALAATLLSLPLATMAAAPAPQESTADTGAVAQAKLDRFCSPEHMKTYQGQVECLQESAGQANNYANSFFNAFLKKLDIPAKGLTTETLAAAIGKTITDPDDGRKLRFYAPNCSQIQDVILSPDEPLNFGHTTAYGLSKSCVETAASLSGKYGIKTDTAEGERLNKHFTKIYQYYAAHPAIPAHDMVERKTFALSGCTRDNRGISLGLSLSVKGPSEKIAAFDFTHYQANMTKIFQTATRRNSADDFISAKNAPKLVHDALKGYNDAAGKSHGLTIEYTPRTQDTEITTEPIQNCLKFTA